MTPCPACGAPPGQFHGRGCQIERCPRCGLQLIGCDCIYEINGLDPNALDTKHPEILRHGLTEAMVRKMDQEWGARRMRWTGEYPGVAQCREWGWYARRIPGERYWHRCEPTDEGAMEDLNRIIATCRWNPETQLWERPQ